MGYNTLTYTETDTMTDKKWETIFKRMQKKFKDGGDASQIINETIILQVLKDIFNKDKCLKNRN